MINHNNLLKLSLLLCVFFIESCTESSDKETVEAPEEVIIEEMDASEDPEEAEEDSIPQDSLEHDGSNEIEGFYAKVIQKIDPKLEELRLVKKGYIDIPSSLGEEFEGGGIFPSIMEIYEGTSLIGVILYDIDDSYPMTFSFAFDQADDGFYAPVVHYDLLDVASHPVLKVIRSVSGLLDEGPFQQSYFSVRGAGHLPSPLLSAEGQVFSEEEEGKVMNKLVDRLYPRFSFTKNCPKEITDEGPKNIQLEFGRYGVLTKTEYTGFTTALFYFYPNDSTLVGVPVEKYMVSPEDELVHEELANSTDTVNFNYVMDDLNEVVRLNGEAEYIPIGTFCK